MPLGIFELGLVMRDDARLVCVVPLPRFPLPHSESHKVVDAEGRFCCDVVLSLRGLGLVARHRG